MLICLFVRDDGICYANIQWFVACSPQVCDLLHCQRQNVDAKVEVQAVPQTLLCSIIRLLYLGFSGYLLFLIAAAEAWRTASPECLRSPRTQV
jgi:hypothetical protein